MTEPTDADRDDARRILLLKDVDRPLTNDERGLMERVAWSLAVERERARAPFFAIAERFAAQFGGAYVDPDEVYDWLVKQETL